MYEYTGGWALVPAEQIDIKSVLSRNSFVRTTRSYDPIVLVVAFVVSMDRRTLKQYEYVLQ